MFKIKQINDKKKIQVKRFLNDQNSSDCVRLFTFKSQE